MKKLLLIIVAATMVVSCEKKEEIIDVSKTRYLMDGFWQLKASKLNPDINDENSVEMDQFPDLQLCLKDNVYKFWTPSQFTVYDGLVKCDVTQPDSLDYFWKFTDGKESYMIVYSNEEFPDESLYWHGEMTYLTIDTFIVDYTETDESSGITSRTFNTYVKLK